MELLILAVWAAFPAALALWAYRQGLRDGMAKAAGAPPQRLVRLPRPGQPPKPDQAARRLGAILANVESYDGSPKGQKKVVE